MPESSDFNALDTGLRRYDELIRASLEIYLRWLASAPLLYSPVYDSNHG
jgi:hypothetical protein